MPINILAACGNLPYNMETNIYKAECTLGQPLQNAHTLPYLKSHLQKCVRKGNAGLAVRTCKELLQLDVLQVVRRISIIMVEDVDLHPSFNILLWWTIVLSKQAAQRKQNGLSETLTEGDVPRYLIEWLLGLTHMLCVYNHRRFFDLKRPTYTLWSSVQECHAYVTKTIAPHRLHENMLHTLRSVLVRTSYGGLKGDIQLLKSVYCTYNETLQTNQLDKQHHTLWNAIVKPIVYESVQTLSIELWDLDAVDFHIAHHILDKVIEWSHDQSIDVKRMMWENGSSVNVRDMIHPSEKYAYSVWRTIVRKLRNYQIYLLERNISTL